MKRNHELTPMNNSAAKPQPKKTAEYAEYAEKIQLSVRTRNLRKPRKL
jgi:hypothetical protein